MNKYKLKKELKKSFNPPAPARKEIFLRELNYTKSNPFEVYLLQVKYINKRFWLLSLLILIFSIYFINSNVNGYKQLLDLSSLLPLFMILTIGEINKSISYNMMELEMGCKYNLQRVTLIKMTIIGTFHFILMLVLLIVFSKNSDISFLKTTLYCITPYMLVNYLSLLILNKIKMSNNTYICNSVIFFVSVMLFYISNNRAIYTYNITNYLLIILIILTILTIKESITLVKERDDLQCHLKLTV